MSQAAAPRESRREVLVDAMSIGLAVGAYGLSFGALATTAGLTVGQTIAMSSLTFTGASQFAFVGVVGSGGSWIAAMLAAWFLGVRNALYGLSRAAAPADPLATPRGGAAGDRRDDRHDGQPATCPHRAARLLGHGHQRVHLLERRDDPGALGAQQIGDPRKLGLDAAVGAAFLALLWPRLSDRTARLTAGLAALVALALTPVLPPGVPVLAAAAVAVVVAWPTPRGTP